MEVDPVDVRPLNAAGEGAYWFAVPSPFRTLT